MEVFVRRKITAIVASTTVILGVGISSAVPAQAVTNFTFSNCQAALNGQTVTVPSGTSNMTISFTSCTVTTPAAGSANPQTNPNFILSNTANPLQPGGGNNSSYFNVSGQLSLNVSSGSGTASISGSKGGGPGNIVDGIYTVYFAYYTSAPSSYYGSFTVDVGGSGGGGSTSSASAPLETLSLAVAASGATCAGGDPTGYSGSWLTLPSADQCTQSGPTAKPGAKLLGWATSASFPIARAQAQIDKKWGVIDEEIDGVRMIFIPAGMATFVSGSTTLFPIWSA
jgi:hypothetical protein